MKDRWKNRRAMAWTAFVASIAFPLLILFTDSNQLADLATQFYLFTGAVVGSYFGWATWDDVRGKKDE